MRILVPTSAFIALSLTACGKSPAPADAATPPADTAQAASDASAPPAGDTATAAGDAATPTPADAAQAAPDASAAADTAAPKDCVDDEVARVLGGLEPDFARLDKNVLELCGGFQDGPRHCVDLDLDTGKRTVVKLPDDDVAHLPSFPAGFDAGLMRDEARGVLKVCVSAETGCKDLHPGQVTAGHFDADKKRVVVASMEDGQRNARIFDVANQAEGKVIPIGPGDLPDCTFAAFLGNDTLLVSTGQCAAEGQSWLVDVASGKTIDEIGKSPNAFVRDGQFAQVDGDVWAFRDATGKVVHVQNVKTGDIVATVDLESAATGTAPKDEHAWAFARDGKLVLVEARPALGTVFIADPKDGSVTQSLVPRPCK